MSTVRILALGALLVVGFAGVSAAQSTTTPPTRPDSGLYRPTVSSAAARVVAKALASDVT